MKRDVFISYSSHDKVIADAICARLEQDQIRCWIAPRDILPGVEFGAAIIEAIEASSIMLIVFSAKANESPQVRREVERAVSKGRIVIPVRIENVLPTKALEYALANTHWLDAMSRPLDAHIAKLSDTIRQLLSDVVVPPPPPPPSPPPSKIWAKVLWSVLAVVLTGALVYTGFKQWHGVAAPSRNEPKTESTVVIGDQVWMTENLNVSAFNNGDPIPEAKNPEEWAKAGKSKTPAWCYYGNDPADGQKYGRLYNWYAVADPRGLAPAGFHIPTKAEWERLLANCGGEGEPAYAALITSGATKFNALFGGMRHNEGMFLLQESVGYWSGSEGFAGSGSAFQLVIDGSKKFAKMMYYYNAAGLSVRCLKGLKPADSNPVDEYRRLSGKTTEEVLKEIADRKGTP